MYQNYIRKAIDPAAPYLPIHYGVFELPVIVGRKKRKMLAYVPEKVRESASGILILGGNGESADDLLHESGWLEVTELEEWKEKMIVFFLEPEKDGWNLQEEYGKADGDVAYVTAAAQEAAKRQLFSVHESKFYLFGCREGGVIAHMAAAWNPAFYAGIATVGGSDVNPSWLSKAEKDYCTNLYGFDDVNHSLGIHKGDIPVPAWIVDDPAYATGTGEAVLKYWMDACGTQKVPRQIHSDQVVYERVKPMPYEPSQEKEACIVSHSVIKGSSENHARALIVRLWDDFLCRQRRWMGSPGGDLRVTRDPVRDLGMEYHYEEFEGWKREWYVYVPGKVKSLTDGKVPLVFALHGYTCSGEIYAGNSEWFKVADRYGFLVVHPTALYGTIDMHNDCIDPDNTPLPAWNIFEEDDRPNELSFFNMLLDRMLAEYPVDPARVFVTGHSWGSLMTQMLALAEPERFAAAAPCSGVFFGGAEKLMLSRDCMKNRPDVEIPVWMFCGEKEEFLIDAVPKNDNATGFNIAMWLKNNHMEEQIPADWADCHYVADGRWHNRFFEKDGVPMVRFTSVACMPHATMTEMSFTIWEDFFSHFARVKGKIIFH